MRNRDTASAWRYHNATKHSRESVRSSTHFLDWSNQPRLFKQYADLAAMPLPAPPPDTGGPALFAIQGNGEAPLDPRPVRLDDIVSILQFSAGITRRRLRPGGEIAFRAASCTGALYEIELYLVCGDLEGLDAGVYHFDPARVALRQLRQEDCRPFLVHAAPGEPSISAAPVTILCTGVYWRNAWKYQARTYRHFGWDNGTIIANMLAIARARDLPAKVVHGFVDSEVNQLLGLETKREVALNLVPIGRSADRVSQTARAISPLAWREIPYSRIERDYPAMREIHTDSSLDTPEEVEAWRRAAPVTPPPLSEAEIPLLPIADGEMPRDSIEAVIRRRGSTRRFSRSSISFDQLSTCLYTATQGVPADFVDPAGSQLNDVYLICNAVDGLENGAYVMHRRPWQLQLVRRGEFRQDAGFLGLEQQLPADAAADVFFLADLNAILERYGNRGYRAAQLEAGIIGGRLYLSAYAQRLGATGLTFYDDDVTRFFSPHAESKSAIFLVAIGHTNKYKIEP